MAEINNADQVEITYYTDPLCCWSWAMEPQWRRLRYEYEGNIRWRYCMGGLLPGWKNFIDQTNAISRPIQMGPLWVEATHLSGMPMKNSIWVHNPPSSSYLACIAVKTAEKQSAYAGERYLRLVREAVMINGKDISSLPILSELAESMAASQPGIINPTLFKKDLEARTYLEDFRADLNEVSNRNIKRFPTMIFRKQGSQSMMLSGYRPYVVLMDVMNKIAPGIKKRETIEIEAYRNYWGPMMEREEREILVNNNDKNIKHSEPS